MVTRARGRAGRRTKGATYRMIHTLMAVMIETADLVVLNKCDLLQYVQFDAERFQTVLDEVNPHAPVLRVSATRGDALPAWYRWLAERHTGAS